MQPKVTPIAFLAALMLVPLSSFAAANYVYHERTTADPGCGGQYVTTLNPTSAQTYALRWKIEYQFYTTDTRVYYTTNGANPMGTNGVPGAGTSVVTGTYTCTFGSPLVDVASATIPAFPEGTTVKYIISAWHNLGGPEIFANSGEFISPFSNSSQATVFSYTVGSTTNLYWDSNGSTAGAGSTPGSWGSSAFWSSTFDGTSATAAWTSGRNAIFSAGTDATASNNVPLVGSQTAASLTIEEGHVSFLSSNAVVLSTGNVNINSGATLTVDTSGRISQAVGATWNVNGGTIRNQNPANAGSFVPVAASITLGAGGATFEQPVTNILSIIESSNVISGTGGITKTGIGVLALAGTNTYAGPTVINEGELRMRTAGISRLPTNTAVTVGPNGIFNLNGIATTIGSLSGSGRVGFSATTLFINGSADSIFSGTLTNQANYGASGAATGAGRISHGGTGTLTITGTNYITGSITNLAGSINVATNAILCDPTLDLYIHTGFLNLSNSVQSVLSLRGTNNGTVNLGVNHTLRIGGSSTHTFQGSITGPGSIERTNLTGVWIVTNASSPNSYTGPTFIRGGAIQVTYPAALGSTNGNTQVFSGGEVRFDGVYVTFTNSEPLTIAGAGASGGAAIAIQNGASPTLNGPITVTGDSWISVSGSASGTIASSINATANQNLFLAGGANSAGIKLISGNISLGAGGIIKTNGGEWVLTGNNNYSGPTLVLQGALRVGNVAGSATGSGSVTVSNGASLTGNGTIAGPVVVNGTLSPGNTNLAIASLTLDDNVTLSGTTTTRIDINKSLAQTSDRILGINSFTAGGVLNATNSAGAPALVAGDSFLVFDAASYAGSFSSITPAIPGAGLAWDLPFLNTTGTLRVHAAPVAGNDEASVVQGQTTTIPTAKLLANDTGELGETLSITAVSANASLGGGLVTYTAPLSGTSDTITYTLNDGRGGTNTGTINVTLTAGTSQGFNQLAVPENIGGNSWRLSYLGIPGTNYALDWRTNLTLGSWFPVTTNVAGPNGQILFTNSSSEPENYYRTRYVP